MGKTLAYKILENHLQEGTLVGGEEIRIKIDQTLTQDSTGTMAYLQLEAMGVDRVKTELSLAYIDHNMLQAGFENADDHAFIASCANKYGIVFSKPGGGICHQVHLERFGKPGKTLLGSDSHTPTNGGLGSLAIGAGGLDVAVAMAKGFYYLKTPKVYNIYLTGKLERPLNGKDVILKVLQELTVKGGVGYIMEYSGPGVKSLSLTDRATICNMGAELGATTSLFPSDERTFDYLKRQGRPEDYTPLEADPDACYDERLEIDLSKLTPLIANPHSPDAVTRIDDLESVKVDQVIIGSCTNSSYSDLMRAAKILEGKTVHPDTSLVIAPGSANVLRLISENGALASFIKSGARIIESACGPCIGMGQAPKSGGVSLRSFNRNFKGRSGTKDAHVYLASPETCAISAIHGYITSPEEFQGSLEIEEMESYGKVDSYLVYPDGKNKEVIMGPNIQPFPLNQPIANQIQRKVLFKTGDNITTDDIVPSNAKLLPYRSNIPKLAECSFTTLIPDFAQRAKDQGGGFILAGENYGQGSSREHAALVPLYLGIKAVFAKSFARIHKANLINNGILPLVFAYPDDYAWIEEDDKLQLDHLKDAIENEEIFHVKNLSKNRSFECILEASKREREILQLGGYLYYAKNLE